jgi:hypothetical protein
MWEHAAKPRFDDQSTAMILVSLADCALIIICRGLCHQPLAGIK